MTCRHGYGDPDCSSSAEYQRKQTQKQLDSIRAKQPDAKNYQIEDATRVGEHLVLKVLYPNCAKCSYEGHKIMVFLNVSELNVLRWTEIDPHFRDDGNVSPVKAPSPSARFPASSEGWKDAIEFAKSKGPKVEQVPLSRPPPRKTQARGGPCPKCGSMNILDASQSLDCNSCGHSW